MSKCNNVKKVFVKNKSNELQDTTFSKSGIDISKKAAEKILYFLKSEKKKVTEWALKVTVVKDGCSGNSYLMEIASISDAKANNDKIFEKNGALVVIDKLSYLFVVGSKLDYQESLLASGFQLLNPKVKKECSCGSSFSI